MTDDLSELGLVLAVVGVAQHVLVVTVVRHVAVLRDQVDVEDADVDAKSRLAIPVEVPSTSSQFPPRHVLVPRRSSGRNPEVPTSRDVTFF